MIFSHPEIDRSKNYIKDV